MRYFSHLTSKKISLILAILIWMIIVSIIYSNNMPVVGVTLIICAVFGFIGINSFTMSNSTKLILSFLIGAFVAPYFIGKMLEPFVSRLIYSIINKRNSNFNNR